jgi:ATP synthase protein I
MEDAIRLRQSRRKAWKEQGERPLWKNLSMVGALGWLIVVPTLIGVFAGRWLDRMFDTGVTFSGALTFAGVCLGFYLAWKRMNEK